MSDATADTMTPVKRKRGRPRKTPVVSVGTEANIEATDVRVPFGGLSYKLEVVNKDPNYHYRWFRNESDRLTRALRAGFEFVSRRSAGGGRSMERLTNKDVHGGNQSITDRFEVHGGRDDYGREFNLVLMRQPMEYHLQDAAAKAAASDDIDMSIRRQASAQGNVANKYGNVTMTVADQE